MFDVRLAVLALAASLLLPASGGARAGDGPRVHVNADTPELARSEGERRRHGKRRRKSDDGGEGGGNTLPCAACTALDGFVEPGQIDDEVRLMVGKTMGGDKAHAVEIQKARGGIETGLKAAFINGAGCPEIDAEQWAIDYSHKRSTPAIHKGVDIPQPRGTPIRAVAAGVVVGKFMNEHNRKGIEVVLRHMPEDTGIGLWTYSQYTHLQEMSPLAIGARVAIGDEIGKTANTGVMGRRERRDALHFAIMYSRAPEWSNDGIFVIPKDGYWMDPNAFYRPAPPYESQALAAMPDDAKSVPVSYMKPDRSMVPPTAKRIWPYPCP